MAKSQEVTFAPTAEDFVNRNGRAFPQADEDQAVRMIKQLIAPIGRERHGYATLPTIQEMLNISILRSEILAPCADREGVHLGCADFVYTAGRVGRMYHFFYTRQGEFVEVVRESAPPLGGDVLSTRVSTATYIPGEPNRSKASFDQELRSMLQQMKRAHDRPSDGDPLLQVMNAVTASLQLKYAAAQRALTSLGNCLKPAERMTREYRLVVPHDDGFN